MGFVSLIASIRDLSPWKKILDYGVNSNVVTSFATDSAGKIVLFDDGLVHLTKLPARTLSRMPVRSLREHLASRGGPKGGPESDEEDLFRRKDYRGTNDQGTLIWWGFPIGTLPQPAGLYFLAFFDRMPPEKQIETVEYPEILKIREKIQIPVARHLLDEADQNVLMTEIPRLMEWEDLPFKHHRVFLVDGVTLDDGPRPIYLQFDGPEEKLRMFQENVSMGDVQFFKKISESGPRPALIEHTEKNFRYEIMLPLTWYIHVLGWIGIALPTLDTWMKPVRLNFEEIVRNIGDALGEERMSLGLLPHYDVHRGLFEEESFMTLMEEMITRHPPRPFVLLGVRMDPAHRDLLQTVLDRAKRPSDILAQVGANLVILFPDQDVGRAKAVETRYREVLGRFVATRPDVALTISVFWFPSQAWSGRELMAALEERPKIDIVPTQQEQSSGQGFDDWFKRFLVLKDWE